MRQPLYKVLLSYLFDVRIDDAPSTLSPHLYVTLSKGRYQLTTSHAIYSYADLYGNFVLTFAKLHLDKLPGKEVLLLGFGLGSIPYMLEKRFHRNYSYTGIEKDPQIIAFAQKYVLDELKSPVQLLQEDAVEFVQNTTRTWDMICVDLFVDDVIPPSATTWEFLRDLKRCTSPDGVILYNCLSRTKEDVLKSHFFLREQFFEVFPEGDIVDTQGNWIAVSERRFMK